MHDETGFAAGFVMMILQATFLFCILKSAKISRQIQMASVEKFSLLYSLNDRGHPRFMMNFPSILPGHLSS